MQKPWKSWISTSMFYFCCTYIYVNRINNIMQIKIILFKIVSFKQRRYLLTFTVNNTYYYHGKTTLSKQNRKIYTPIITLQCRLHNNFIVILLSAYHISFNSVLYYCDLAMKNMFRLNKRRVYSFKFMIQWITVESFKILRV